MSYYCDKGTIFGLTSSDLTEEQLRKVDFKKLIEFIEQDERIEAVLSDKIKNVNLSHLSVLRNYKNLNKFNSFFEAYNNRIKSVSDSEIRKDFGYNSVSRYDFIFWDMLDEKNRILEIERWSKGQSSIVRNESVDFAWLYANNKALADEITKNVISRNPDYDTEIIVSNLVKHLPKEEIENVIPIIKEKYSKSYYKDAYLNILGNANMPPAYIVDALRILAKKTKGLKVSVKINEEILRQLPPITRLEALENIFRNHDPYSSVNNPIVGIEEQTIRSLLFSAVIKHPSRVEELIKGMKNRRLIK